MSAEPARGMRSRLIGDLALGRDLPDDAVENTEVVPVLVELNLRYPGGLAAVTSWFCDHLWAASHLLWAGEPLPPDDGMLSGPGSAPAPPPGLARVTASLYKCQLTRSQLRALLAFDRVQADLSSRPSSIFKIWPDYELTPQIDRSAPTVKADAAWRAYQATGQGIVWAVLDSGVDARHGHFAELEIAAQAAGVDPPPGAPGLTTGLHRDFRDLVGLRGGPPPVGNALTDELGHGTHVAGIIVGRAPDRPGVMVAASSEPPPGMDFTLRRRVGRLSGMAPDCQVISLKVLRQNAQGQYVTSSSALIAALEYLRCEVNVNSTVLRVHGVNLSLGCPWRPRDYAAGQSPLCQAINQLVDSGVVAVVAAGNHGAGPDPDAPTPVSVLGSILEPAHAQNCIAVGSTHREAPHAFGVTWTSSRGPTLDGRAKPDVVGPGEWITSAATGLVAAQAGFTGRDPTESGYLTYAEQSGTSMAAPHVSGVIAAFLSARPEFIGKPDRVKELLLASATDLGRLPFAQGAGLVDLMRMLSSV